jgi:hypothetical protein
MKVWITLLLIGSLFLIAACQDAVDAGSEGPSCLDLSESECIDSAACTLTQPDGVNTAYVCGSPPDHCGSLFRQRDGAKSACETKTGCEFVEPACYCPPEQVCSCSGGPPRQCVDFTGPGT